MKIKGITELELRWAVNVAASRYDNNITFNREPERKGNFLHFTLTVENSNGPGARRSHQGRKIKAACWHAHRDVMHEIFNLAPDAVLITAVARYDGFNGFRQNYPGTGGQNIGSMMQPMAYEDACECE